MHPGRLHQRGVDLGHLAHHDAGLRGHAGGQVTHDQQGQRLVQVEAEAAGDGQVEGEDVAGAEDDAREGDRAEQEQVAGPGEPARAAGGEQPGDGQAEDGRDGGRDGGQFGRKQQRRGQAAGSLDLDDGRRTSSRTRPPGRRRASGQWAPITTPRLLDERTVETRPRAGAPNASRKKPATTRRHRPFGWPPQIGGGWRGGCARSEWRRNGPG